MVVDVLPSSAGRPRRHRQLASMLKVGVIGFGGGSALIPVMERELVTSHGGLSEKTFAQHVVIANITPGALPVKLAVLSGIQLGGATLATASALVVALPGAALTVGLLASFAAMGPKAIRIIEFASLGINAFIIFLLANYVTKVIGAGSHQRVIYVSIALGAYLLTGADKTAALVSDLLRTDRRAFVPEVSAVGLIAYAIAGIALYSIYQHVRFRPTKTSEAREQPPALRRITTALGMVLTLTVLSVVTASFAPSSSGSGTFLSLITLSTLSSFGGGEAYVGVADGFFVASGIVDTSAFYGQIVPVANALPGPILVKIAAGLGYVVGLEVAGPVLGLLLALAAYLASIGSCCAVALAVLAAYDKTRQSLFARNLTNFILPVICGLLASTSISMMQSNIVIAGDAGIPGAVSSVSTLALAGAVALVHRFLNVPDILVIAACSLLSLGALMVIVGL